VDSGAAFVAFYRSTDFTAQESALYAGVSARSGQCRIKRRGSTLKHLSTKVFLALHKDYFLR
jgi:hypothetical protein